MFEQLQITYDYYWNSKVDITYFYWTTPQLDKGYILFYYGAIKFKFNNDANYLIFHNGGKNSFLGMWCIQSITIGMPITLN